MREEPLEYTVIHLPEPVEIDGDWNKPAWRKIESLVVANHMGDVPDHRPRVMVRLAWDEDALHIMFRVEDRYVRAVAKAYQDPVCRDSCVEFFFTPGDALGAAYFNLEINCGGTMLFWWHPEGETPIPVAPGDCDRIDMAHSLPKIIDPEIQDPTPWTIACRLPFAVVKTYCPEARQPAPGVVWKANFYKCGDGTSHPHWLTWSVVDYPTPRFHMPEDFGRLKFEQGGT